MSIEISVAVKSKKPYVYALAYPESMGGRYFYVGKGTGSRIYQHEYEAKGKARKGNAHKCNTIRKIWAEDEKVQKFILALFDDDTEAYIYEEALIFFMYGLTNQVDGGKGVKGLVFTQETRRKMSEARQGKPAPTKGKPSPLKGTTFTDEHKKNVSLAKKGQPSSLKGTPRPQSTRDKISAAIKAHWAERKQRNAS